MQFAIIIRSIVFNTVLFSVLSISLLFGSIFLLLDKKYVFIFWHRLSLTLDFLTAKIGGITYTIENKKNILQTPAIYAVRHESAWETLILIHKFKKPIFVLKKELMNIPIFGALAKKSGAIEIDRDNGVKALINASRRIENSLKNGHHVIIFPEGTRVSNGRHVQMKRGISFFYKKASAPVIPVVHNSGKFWPRRGFIKKSGNISLIFAEPIEPGLSQDEFMEKLNFVFHQKIEQLKNTKEEKCR